MRAERAVDVVVLAVYVGSDSAAHGDVARPRRHRQESSTSQQRRNHVGEKGSATGDDVAVLEHLDARQRGEIKHVSAGVLGGIAVRPSCSTGKDSTRASSRNRRDDILDVADAHHTRAAGHREPPPGEELVVGRRRSDRAKRRNAGLVRVSGG